MAETSLFRPVDDDARALARQLLTEARHGALGVLIDGRPFVTRIALARDADGAPMTLISDLAPHTAALRTAPEASLMVGEPGPKGDPLAYPRLTIDVTARFTPRSEGAQTRYLACQPKAQLYIGFADFHLVRLEPTGAHLNGGFGKAYRLAASDLLPPGLQ